MKFISALLLTLTLFTFSASAHEEDQLGMLKGENLSLYYTDHAMSGHINGQLVYATPFEKEFGIKLTHRTKGQDFQSEFKQTAGVFSGKIEGLTKAGAKSETEVKLTKVNGKEGWMEGTVANIPFKVQITSKTMEGHHFVNPEFDVTLPNGNYKFVLENGKACMGCATKIVFVVLGMLQSTESL